jgi:CHAT domain-containing protein
VIADGILQYVPFAALPDPEAPAGAAAPPLVVRHEVVHLPSASALDVLRRETAGRPPAPRQLAVLADPVFTADDPRLAGAGVPSAEPSGASVAGARGEPVEPPSAAAPAAAASYRRLPFSRLEAEGIAGLVPADQRLTALGLDASRTAVDGAALAGYRLLHFATHAVIDDRRPELSGLVLSLVDRRGEPVDGTLRLLDVYNLRLDADLVTLSACESALGKEVRGEGLVGLTRGFLYAGAARVVASLWSVQDRATAELMKRFYRGMLAEGRPPAEALRAAQLSMLAEARWNEAYYWAPFVLQGEWR